MPRLRAGRRKATDWNSMLLPAKKVRRAGKLTKISQWLQCISLSFLLQFPNIFLGTINAKYPGNEGGRPKCFLYISDRRFQVSGRNNWLEAVQGKKGYPVKWDKIRKNRQYIKFTLKFNDKFVSQKWTSTEISERMLKNSKNKTNFRCFRAGII